MVEIKKKRGERNGVFATNSNFLISISLQPDCVNISQFLNFFLILKILRIFFVLLVMLENKILKLQTLPGYWPGVAKLCNFFIINANISWRILAQLYNTLLWTKNTKKIDLLDEINLKNMIFLKLHKLFYRTPCIL